EFLASTDERFRPVSLYDGPDGALYVVDMYRGVIQHKAFLTEYLTKEIKSRELEEPLNCGRIYKILPAGEKSAAVLLPEDPEQLVKLLQDRNGWVRDKAQQMLVDGKYTAAVPALRGLLQQTDKPITVSHALWTLEGLQALQPADILPLLQQRERHIRAQAITVLSSVMTRQTYRKYLPAVQELVKEKDSVTAPYLAFLAYSFRQYDQREADNLLKDIIKQYPDDPHVCDAAINSLAGREKIFLTAFPDTVSLINKGLGKILVNIAKDRMKSDRARLAKQFPEGYKIFNTVCQSCHGEDGNGIKSLAPPLNGSEWVTGDKNKLISIVLFGLTGPIKVSGKIYDRPEVSGEMPAIGNDHTLTDEAIAQLLSYIRNSWNNKAEPVAEPEISRIRLKLKGRQEPFTMKELKK
ncbi:MAG TPA: c-type cytochrome, partial [Chitinophagaceae bacterium]